MEEQPMPEKRRHYTAEYREQAVRMVIERSRPIATVARELGLIEGTLGNWVNKYRRDHVGEEPALPAQARARLAQLERENRELRMQTEFLKKAAAYFAQDHR